MPNMTLAIPSELKIKMEKHPEINWSEVARQAIGLKMQLLDQMDAMLEQSVLCEPGAQTYAVNVKPSMMQNLSAQSKKFPSDKKKMQQNLDFYNRSFGVLKGAGLVKALEKSRRDDLKRESKCHE